MIHEEEQTENLIDNQIKISPKKLTRISQMIQRYYPLDESYAEEITKQSKLDGVIAILFYILLLVAYYVMGVIYATRQLYFVIGVNLMFAFFCLAIIIIRKQKFSSVGIGISNITGSLRLGFYSGLSVLIIFTVIPNVIMGKQLVSFEEILYQVFYHFLIIGFVEELLFRGYLQTRIHVFISRESAAVFVTGILFLILHIPFQMASANLDLTTFLLQNWIWLLTTLFWHFVFYALYRRYNSIVASTIFHGFLNIGNRLFRP